MEIINNEVRHNGPYSENDLPEILGKQGDIPLLKAYLSNGDKARQTMRIMFQYHGQQSCYACKFYSHGPVFHNVCSHFTFEKPKDITIDTFEGCGVFEPIEDDENT